MKGREEKNEEKKKGRRKSLAPLFLTQAGGGRSNVPSKRIDLSSICQQKEKKKEKKENQYRQSGPIRVRKGRKKKGKALTELLRAGTFYGGGGKKNENGRDKDFRSSLKKKGEADRRNRLTDSNLRGQ